MIDVIISRRMMDGGIKGKSVCLRSVFYYGIANAESPRMTIK